MINGCGMGGYAVLGQDVVGNGAFVTGVSMLSSDAGTGVPCSLDECSANQPQCCKPTY